jgi:hypothetical protein
MGTELARIDDKLNNDTGTEVIVLVPEEIRPTQDAKSQTTDEEIWDALSANLWLWHDPDKEPYVTVQIEGHHENHRLKGRTFELWMQRRFYEQSGRMPKPQALAEQLRLFEGEAIFDGVERQTHIRVARDDDVIYIDLGDEAWQAIKVTKAGWVITSDPPVAFVRPRGMRPLSEPVHGGSIQDLQNVINLGPGDDLKIFVTWMLAALRPAGPFPILCLNGEQGAAKTTAARMVRRLIDPNSAETRSSPREERDLLIAARNGWVINLDNLSQVKEWLSDALCRLATGGGFGARQLYTDTDEIVFEAKRPIVINGIPALASRPDLGDRCLVLVLPTIAAQNRIPEAVFWQRFEEKAPRILGLLMDAVSQALRDETEVRDDAMRDKVDLPRMADAALWMEAAAPAFGWQRDTILPVLMQNQADVQKHIVDADVVANAVERHMKAKTEWKGNSTELLSALNIVTSEDIQRTREWPKSPSSLSAKLRRAAPGIRMTGIAVAEQLSHGRTIWTLKKKA